MWQYAVPAHAIHRHYRGYGLEHAHRAIEEHGGGVFALAHFGSWDVAASCGYASGLRITTVMAPVGPDLVTRIAAWARRRQELEVLAVVERGAWLVPRGAPRPLRRDPQRHPRTWRHRRRRLLRRQGGVHHRARMAGARRRRAGAAGALLRYKGLYRLVVHPPVAIEPGDSDAVVMQRVATALEAPIRQAPEWWYPFNKVYED